MQRIVIVALVALSAWPSSSVADPTAFLAWDGCDSQDVNKDFAGPGVYRQVITGVGFEAPVRGFWFRLHVTASNVYDYPSVVLPDAWRFDLPSGCQNDRLAIGAPATPCLALSPSESFAVSYDYNGLDLDITLVAAFATVQPDPGARYTLFALDYDHSRSASGPQDPMQACGGVERGVCFVIRDAQWTGANLDFHPISFQPFSGVSWQDDHFSCFSDLAVRQSRWTQVKLLYR